ncbi:MAG: hypothetical protein R6W88_08670 [Desulfobacterales bacterium]
MRHEYVATCKDSLLLIIDFQLGLLKAMDSWERIACKVGQLIRTADTLGVPVLVTEQYKKDAFGSGDAVSC